MPIKLTDLIARVPAEVEARIKRVRDQTRPVLQEALRTECRLMMRTSEDGGQNRQGALVPIEVSTGYPAILENITFPVDYELIMLLGRYRTSLEQAEAGVTGLLQLRQEMLRRLDYGPLVRATDAELQSTVNWASTLLQLFNHRDPLKTIFAVREDFLGIYEYDMSDLSDDEYVVNRATIHIYWGVIGLVTEWMGCNVEDLAIVTLTHELAHAYTQLGADIDGRRWPSAMFAEAERGLIEGLAQYYTERVLRRLERRYGGALKVYETMLPGQPEPYQTHKLWIKDFSPEAVRRAMLEVRRWKEGKLEDFNRRLKEAQNQLHPRRPIT